MKQIAVILILLSLLTSNFSKLFYYADYQLNIEQYKKLCINKARPQMHCNGHCQLMKRIKQEDTKDKQTPERKSSHQEEVLSSKSFFGSIQLFCFDHKQKLRSINDPHTKDFPSTIFRPPGV